VAYEVTKRIKGHDYRYRVESTRDPETGRGATRWIYLGKLEDGRVVAPARTAPRRVTNDEIVAVTAHLIEARDASRVTVAVIAHHAGISPGTFYRHFSDRDSALAAAIAYLSDRVLAALPSLDVPIGTFADERARLNRWFEGLNDAVLHGRAFRWFLTSPAHDRLAENVRYTPGHVDARALLAAYFRRLDEAGLARIDDVAALAHGLMTLHWPIVRDIAQHDDADAAARWAGIFPVIERAVFREKNFEQLATAGARAT
jgi:AcrR family transcriptional regulator